MNEEDVLKLLQEAEDAEEKVRNEERGACNE